MELQIGQKINVNGRHNITVKVCEHKNCDGCFFIYKCKNESRDGIKSLYGECSCLERKDGKNVIFLPISEDNMKYSEPVEGSVAETQVLYQEPVMYGADEKIFFTSDLHLCHDREFIWKVRGFKDVDEMNEAIVHRWNETVSDNDIVYVLGDLMLKDNEKGISILSRLNGTIHIIVGNHDTDNRIKMYRTLPKVKSVLYSCRLRWNGYHFYLTHFPCLTGNVEKESLKQMTLNLSGHTHSNKKFFYDLPYVYNVAVDAHDCRPISIEDIVGDMKKKIDECKEML